MTEDGIIGAITILATILIIYFFPTIIANIRGKNQITAIFLINFFLGWTLIGWVLALVMSVWNDKEVRQE